MSKIHMVSIRDIARATGFSPMTVSRALRNSPKVNPETKANIRSVAQELRYRQNTLVSANMAGIRASKSITYQATIGIIHETPNGGEWMGTQRWLETASQAAEDLGFKADCFDLADPNIAQNDLGRILRNRGIQGIIQAPMVRDFRNYPLDFAEFAIVVSNRGSLPQKFHRVCPDHYGNMDMLLKRIHIRGYQRVGLMIAEDLDVLLNHLSSSRYLAFLQSERLPRLPIFMPKNREDYDSTAFRRWFDENRPDIVITTCETIFRDHFFDRAGLSIPDDLAVVKVNINRSRKYFSGIDEESAEVASTAVNTLAQLLFHNERGLPEKPMSVLVPGKWVEAGTVPELSAV